MTTIGSIVARLVVGQLIADKADKRMMTVVLFVGQAAAVLLYTMVTSTLGIYAVALLFGFTIGNIYMMMSLLTAEIFGILSFGAVYGVVSLAGQLGSGVGLVFIGWAHDATDSYTVPFIVLAAVNVVAAIVITFARPVPGLGATLGRRSTCPRSRRAARSQRHRRGPARPSTPPPGVVAVRAGGRARTLRPARRRRVGCSASVRRCRARGR